MAGTALAAPASEITSLYHRSPLLTITALFLLAVLALGVAAWACANARSRVRGKGADALTILAAAMASSVAASGMWHFFSRTMHLPVAVQAVLFAFMEVAVLSSALRARANVARDGSAGADGLAVWVLTCVSGTLSASDAASPQEALVRLGAPLVAAWLWERSLVPERRARRAAEGRTEQVRWIFSIKRAAVRLGLATALGADLETEDANRRIDRFVRADTRAQRAGFLTRRSAARRRDRVHARLMEQARMQADPRSLYAHLGRQAILDVLARLGGDDAVIDRERARQMEHILADATEPPAVPAAPAVGGADTLAPEDRPVTVGQLPAIMAAVLTAAAADALAGAALEAEAAETAAPAPVPVPPPVVTVNGSAGAGARVAAPAAPAQPAVPVSLAAASPAGDPFVIPVAIGIGTEPPADVSVPGSVSGPGSVSASVSGSVSGPGGVSVSRSAGSVSEPADAAVSGSSTGSGSESGSETDGDSGSGPAAGSASAPGSGSVSETGADAGSVSEPGPEPLPGSATGSESKPGSGSGSAAGSKTGSGSGSSGPQRRASGPAPRTDADKAALAQQVRAVFSPPVTVNQVLEVLRIRRTVAAEVRKLVNGSVGEPAPAGSGSSSGEAGSVSRPPAGSVSDQGSGSASGSATSSVSGSVPSADAESQRTGAGPKPPAGRQAFTAAAGRRPLQFAGAAT